jgi:hypothetical protein
MTTNRQLSVVNLLVVFTEAVLISLALIYLAEYADAPLVRQAGGVVL